MTFPERHHCVFKNSVPKSTHGGQFKWYPWELYITMAVTCVEIMQQCTTCGQPELKMAAESV